MAGRWLAGLIVISFAFIGSAAFARPLELADLWKVENAGSANISPDGETIVYRRTRVDATEDRYDSELWIMSTDGSDARFFADGWDAIWLPDGRLTYNISGPDGPQRLVQTVADVEEKRADKIMAVTGTPLGSPVFSRGGSQMAWVGSVPREGNWPIDLPKASAEAKVKEDPIILDELQYRVGVGRYRTSDRHIFIAPTQGGEARQITSGRWNVGSYYSGIGFGTSLVWDKDDDSIVFDGYPDGPDTLEGALTSHINRVDLETLKISRLNPLDGFWRMPRISPDGRHIAYVGYQDKRAAFAERELRVMNADGSGDRLLWCDTPDRIFQMEWGPDSDAVYASMNHKGATELVEIKLDGMRRTVASGEYRFYLTSIADDIAVGSYNTIDAGAEIATVNLESGEVNVLTRHSAALNGIDLAQVETIWTTAPDGTRVQGWLYRPHDFDPSKSYPLILDIHGGPDAMAGYDFDFRYHDFAARGYMVLMSNPRGSTGYGAAFANAIQGGFPGEKDLLDLESILGEAIGRGSVDQSRMYVMGCSGGGFLAAWLAGRTKYFAAGAVMCPVINWTSFPGASDAISWAYTRFDKPFWESPEEWLAHSPIMEAGSIDIPLLIAVGANDQRTPVEQAAELYTALKIRGVPTRLMVFPNAGHGPWRSVPSDLMRLQLYLDEWFRTLGHPGKGQAENP